ncbi:lysylphosphatidylglycerol synthase transmembrane domain-containing protein [Oscillatoria sp. CS-180]|uniref:lysylphosphatidylglycerol synthase transmembrane domain-containing protein n=1 Tax=Oscillatoria sp. CS-180 TaxID=3021720 RepID=UPI00232CCB91|nr:lysylphosphatidylglycerol synthase transmembrane domain-containing protein [Oscillatoria sp. CS-180]MDB9524503.1 lysylphosphatidylglycerol synthase transmembrane domain-containing protein [Oscillatoria sp. CS-180]
MKRLISIAVSLFILLLLYWKIDLTGLIQVFRTSNAAWMVISLGMVVPITLFTSQRLQFLMPPQSTLSFWEANRLILAASSLNMVLPAKAGDIAKAYFMRDRGHLNGSLALSLVVFEKACDMLSLLLWCLFGLWLYPQKGLFFWAITLGILAGLTAGILLLSSTRFANLFFQLGQILGPKKIKLRFKQLQVAWAEMHDYFWRDKRQLLKITSMSVFIWLLHLLQIWFFILALNAWTPFITNLALSPLAILAGLLPLTFAGVGTRDAALVFLYAPYFDAATGAALGLLCTSRYFLPAVGGLPFLESYLKDMSWKTGK